MGLSPLVKQEPDGTIITLTAKRGGTVRIRFDGRLSNHQRLAPGRYALTITATAHGKKSKPRTASFTIVR